MKKDFLIAELTTGQINAFIKNIGGLDIVKRVNQGEPFILKFDNQEPLDGLTKLQLFWKNLYKKYFNLDIDVSLIKEVEGKWAIVVAKGITIQQVYDALPFEKQKYTDRDLDTAIPTNDRTSDNNYVVYVTQNIESDEQFKNKSAHDLKAMDHRGITLLERLLLELFYFEETGEHLDTKNATLCSGSRDSDSDAPNVGWCGVRLEVDWEEAPSSYDDLRSRAIVSA